MKRLIFFLYFTLHAKLSGTVYCYRSCLWACLQLAGGRAVSLRYLEIACIDLHQNGSVGAGSDRLQLIKLWPSCAPGKGVCGGSKMFGSALLQPALSVCVSLSAFFFFRCVSVCCGWQLQLIVICRNFRGAGGRLDQ